MSAQSYAAGNKIYGFGRSNPTSGPVDPIGYRERDMQQNAMQAAIARRQPAMAPGGGNPVAGRLPPQSPIPMAGGLPPQHIASSATPTGAIVSTLHQPPAPAPAGLNMGNLFGNHPENGPMSPSNPPAAPVAQHPAPVAQHPAPVAGQPTGAVPNWIRANHPEATNIQMGDPGSRMNGVGNQGYMYGGGAQGSNLHNESYTSMPGQVPQYGIGGQFSPEAAQAHPEWGASTAPPGMYHSSTPAGYVDPAGHGMGGGIPGAQTQPGSPIVGVGAPPVPSDSHGVPGSALSAPPGAPGGAAPAPNFNSMGDPTYERSLADLAMQKGQAQRQYGDAINNLEGDVYGRQRDINTQAPQTYQDLLEHFAGRGLAHSGTYAVENGAAHDNVANQLADLSTKLNDGRNSLLSTLTGSNDNYNSRLAAEREALAQRLGSGVLGTGLGKLAGNSSSDYNKILKSIAGVGKSVSPSSFNAPGRTSTPSRTPVAKSPVRAPTKAPTLGKKR